MMLFPITLITVLFFMVTKAESDCFSMDSDTLCCRGLNLKPDEAISVNTSFPKLCLHNSTGSIGLKTFSLLSHVVMLEIQYSAIDFIEDGALCALPKLYMLYISSNKKFPILTQYLLRNCGKIISFTIGDVRIRPDTFRNMNRIGSLQLSNLEIPHLTKEYLEPLQNLWYLCFQRCKIEKIDAGSFCLAPNLEWLTLDSNFVLPPLTKSMFDNCKTVTQFDLQNNYDVTIEEEVFSGFTSVRYPFLDFLNIKHLKKGHLAGFNNTEKLRLSHAYIAKIDTDTFQGFGNLKLLDLDYNDLAELDSKVFASIPNLIRLDVFRNKLRSIDHLKHPKIEELHVRLNMIAEIDTKAVRLNLPNLKKLAITGNGMSPEYEDRVRKELEGIFVPDPKWN